jgi:hypothetical protein
MSGKFYTSIAKNGKANVFMYVYILLGNRDFLAHGIFVSLWLSSGKFSAVT